MSSFLLLALFACGEKTADDSVATSAEEGHPLVPEQYADSWDIESLGCDDVTVYWAFEGEIESSGALSGKETWYWFFSDEGWDDDCADSFTLEGTEEETPIADNPCLSCDRTFTAAYELTEENTGCSMFADGYEGLLDNDDTDRIDEEKYTMALLLDTDPLGGEPGHINVWTYIQDDSRESDWNDRPISEGTLETSTEGDYSGPGAVEWAREEGLCITITEED